MMNRVMTYYSHLHSIKPSVDLTDLVTCLSCKDIDDRAAFAVNLHLKVAWRTYLINTNNPCFVSLPNHPSI